MTGKDKGAARFQAARRVLEMKAMVESGLALSISEISSRFGVQKASARKYLDFAKGQWDLQSYKRGREQLWVSPGTQWTQDDLDKAAALDFAVNALSDLEGTRYHRVLREAAEVARHRLLGDTTALERVASSFVAVRPERSGNPNYAAYIETLLDAIRERKAVEFRYCRLDGCAGRYEVEPWAVTFHRGRAALVGGKRNVPEARWPPRRTFAIDRITELATLAGPRFVSPSARRFRATTFLRHSFGIYSYKRKRPIEVVLHVRGEAAVLLRDRHVHESQTTLDLEADVLEVRLTVCECPELRSWLLSMVPDVRVVRPVRLAREIRDTCRQYAEESWPDSSQ